MIDVTVQKSTPVINMLDHFQATITIIVPLPTLKAVVAAIAALTVLYLMQANTRISGFGSTLQIIRLVQRAAMAVLAIALVLVAVTALLDAQQFNDLLIVMTLIPLWVMVLCSILVGRYHRRLHGPETDGSAVG